MKTIMASNPYLVLGITSEIAKTVSAEDLDTLVKKHYQVLAKSVHPDRRGEKFTARFRQIQEAHEALVDSETKEHWLADLKTMRTNERGKIRLMELEGQLGTECRKSDLLADQLFRFWSLMSSGQTSLEKDSLGSRSVSIFSSQPISLLMINLLDASMSSSRARSQWVADQITRQAFSKSIYELVVSDCGRLLARQSLARFVFKQDSEIPAGLPPRWIQRRTGKNKSFYWQRIGDKKLLPNYRLIGSIEDTPVFASNRDKETKLDRLIPAQAEPEDYQRVRQNGFSWTMFREYAHAISPVVSVDRQVVAVCSESDGQTVFRLLGKVNQINLLEG